MPLFGRRQSEGNALEHMEKSRSADGGSGFTVLSQEVVAARKARREALEAAEREKASRRSFGFSFASRSKSRASMYEEDSGSSNRGSNASSATNSAIMNLHSTGSSARLSSSSTLPSSVGGEAVDDLYINRSSTYGHPTTPRPLTHRDRASTLGPGETFPRQYAQKEVAIPPLPSHPPPPPPVPQHRSWNRSRATTASSSASTARPPQLDLGTSNFGDFTGDFSEDLFSMGGKAPRPEFQDESSNTQPPRPPPHTYLPGPPSPYSPKETDAGAPLLSFPRAGREESPAPLPSSDLPQKKNNTGGTSVTQSTARSFSRPISQPALRSAARPTGPLPGIPSTQPSTASRPSAPRNPAVLTTDHRKPSHSIDITPSSALSTPFNQDELDNEPLFSPKPVLTTPKPPESQTEDTSPGRMVTAAEFEKMKMLAHQGSGPNDEGDEYASGSDEEESDSEKARKDRWAREKQQGDLAVNRQIYRKTVGGPPDPTQNRFNTQGSTVMASLQESDAQKRQFEHDGDWDVPLAALAAHGFPKTSTPRPSPGARQFSSGSQIDFRSSGQFATDPITPSRPASTVGSVVGQLPQRHSVLPPFAKGLPADPHFGGVVPSHPREQLRFSRSSSVPVVPIIPSGGSQNATLMDVIVGEERARATRRGSPNASGLLGPQNYMQQGSHVNQRMSMAPQQMGMADGGFMGAPQFNNMQAPEVQLLQQQLQFTQQMMVQMQQQMMQMSMQSSAGSMINGQVPSPMPQPGFLQANGFNGQHLGLPSAAQRPMSMAPSMNGMSGGYQQRPMSTYTPSMYGAGRPTGYAPSIAPSERNTIGMSSRYRSVGNVYTDQQSIAPTTNSRPASSGNPIKATLRQAGSHGKLRSPSSDESDEEKYFAEANERAKARRAKTNPDLRDLQENYITAL